MTRTSIFRLAALFLLLLTGAELFACEMIDPQNCEGFGFPKSGADDNCICCCTHIVVADMIVLHPIAERVTSVMTSVAPKPEHKSFSIYHPPRV